MPKHDKLILFFLTIFALILISYYLINALVFDTQTHKSFLLIGQIIAGIIVIYVPYFFDKIFKIIIPQFIKYFF